MTEPEPRRRFGAPTLTRLLVPAGFLLAALLFLLLPVFSASCGDNDTGPAQVCYSGGQLLSGHPSISLVNIVAATDLTSDLASTVTLPAATTALTVTLLVVLGLGLLGSTLPARTVRTAIMLAGSVLGLVALIVLRMVVLPTLTRETNQVLGLFVYPSTTGVTDASQIVSPAIGFWLALFVLLAVALAAGYQAFAARAAREVPAEPRTIG